MQSFGELKIVAIPLATDVNDMPFMKYGNPPELMRRSFEENLAIARETDASPCVIDVTVHAHIFGHPRGARTFRQIVAEAASAEVPGCRRGRNGRIRPAQAGGRDVDEEVDGAARWPDQIYAHLRRVASARSAMCRMPDTAA